METEYKVRLEIFEGPLDLLLYLIKRDGLDIYDISLERITKPYLEKDEKGSLWGCPDLTDSGLGVKNPRSPHENTNQQTSS